MSRWSNEFENHQIHETLRQAREWVNVEVEELDGNHEAERRRLRKALDTMNDIVNGMDPEFYPQQQLTQLNQYLRNQQFWGQLSSYSSRPNVQHLQTANDFLNAQIPAIYSLATPGLKPDTRKTIKSLENAYENFTKAIDTQKSEFEDSIMKNVEKLSEIHASADEIDTQLETLKTDTESSLSNWQTEFTEAQTTRAEEHSADQIQRGEKFDEAMRGWHEKADQKVTEISSHHNEKLQSVFESFSQDASSRTKDMEAKHKDILEIHGLVGKDSVAGGYQKGASEEHKAANLWRWIAMSSLALTASWLILKLFWNVGKDNPTINWPELATAGSLTIVLLAAAGYASRQSRLHREAEQKMRWFALEVKAIDPFISSLPEADQMELKKKLSEKLFGQDPTLPEGSGARINPKAYKSMTDMVMSPVLEIIKAVGKG